MRKVKWVRKYVITLLIVVEYSKLLFHSSSRCCLLIFRWLLTLQVKLAFYGIVCDRWVISWIINTLEFKTFWNTTMLNSFPNPFNFKTCLTPVSYFYDILEKYLLFSKFSQFNVIDCKFIYHIFMIYWDLFTKVNLASGQQLWWKPTFTQQFNYFNFNIRWF